MPYGQNELQNNNINYLGRDFNDLKTNLIEYAQSYFPNTYQDFNETSPGMMLIEMSAYVGDVMSFYIDQQYREMLLPLSEERKNLITLAKSYGYKLKPTTPAHVELTCKCTIGVLADGKPNYATARTINKGMQITSTTNPDLIFETLDVVDFNTSSSADLQAEVTNVDSGTGLPSSYTLTRRVKAVSGETRTHTFNVTEPRKFLKLTLPEVNIIEVISCVDTQGAEWFQVQNLAQDKVPISTHYSNDTNRSTAYTNLDGNYISLPVPFSLEYRKIHKKFVTEVDENNFTTLVFGNGILKNGSNFESTFLSVEQVGINLPGGEENLEQTIDPLLGDDYGTLGQAPAQTTLTITYRVGGGVESNISVGELITIGNITTIPSNSTTSNISVINLKPASGGASGQSIEEIRHRTIGNISTQNRVVTKEDYEARTLNIPARYGNIAKVYAARAGAIQTAQRTRLQELVTTLQEVISLNYNFFDVAIEEVDKEAILNQIKGKLDANKDGGVNPQDFEILYETLELAYDNVTQDDRLATVDLYLLSYDINRNLADSSTIIKQNLKQYLNQFRMLTDQVTIYNGYIINFGIVFDVIAHPSVNKDEVKLQCINAISDYFKIENMQFKQILYTHEIERLISDINGVKAVNYATITQDIDYNSTGGGYGTPTTVFPTGLYTTLINTDGTTSTTTNAGFGYYYDFSKFYGPSAVAGDGVILPAYEPAVFELKDPNNNIKGIVR